MKLSYELQACENERRKRVPQPLRTALSEMSASRQQDAVLPFAVGTRKVVYESSHQVLLLLKVLFIDVLRGDKVSGVPGAEKQPTGKAPVNTPPQERRRRP